MSDITKYHNKIPDWAFALLFFLAGLAVFMAFNFDREPLRLECRFIVFVKEAAQGASTGLFPILYGKPYPDYPATYVLLVRWLSSALGGLSTFAAVLPGAVCVAASLAIAYLAGARSSRRLGVFSALILLTTLGFISGGRSISLDAFVCLASAASFYCAQRLSASVCRRSAALWAAAALLSMLFAFAFRGPIGFVVSAAAFFAFFAGGLEWRKALFSAAASALVFAACLAGFLLLARAEGGDELLRKVFDAQIGGRMASAGKPLCFYFANGMGEYSVAFPLAMLALVFAWKRLRSLKGEGAGESEIKLLRQSLLWGLLVVAGLSVPGTKHLRYILPAAPAFALAAAHLFAYPEIFSLPERLREILRRTSWLHALLVAAIFDAICVFVVERMEISYESSRSFVAATESLRGSSGRLAFYRMGPDGEDIKYICNARAPMNPVFVGDPDSLALERGTLCVAREGEFQGLPAELKERCEVLAAGELGHKKCVAFRTP